MKLTMVVSRTIRKFTQTGKVYSESLVERAG